MKYSEAIKIAMNNAEFARKLNSFKESVTNQHITGCFPFVVGNEAFYYSGEAVCDESTGEYTVKFRGGKYVPASRVNSVIKYGHAFIIA